MTATVKLFLVLPVFVSFAHAEVDFKGQVLPVLQSKCFKCHQEPRMEGGKMIKPKGGLRLDSAAAIMKGTPDGEIVVAGSPDESSLYELVALPAGHDELMPPPGKGSRLSDSSIEAIKQWIKEGADFGGWQGKGAVRTTGPTKKLSFEEILRTSVRPADPAAIEALEEVGATVETVTTSSELLRVMWVNREIVAGDEQMKAMEPLAANISEVDLADTNITDKTLEIVGGFPRMTYLNLRNTKVTDEGVAHLKRLKGMIYLNLYGTQVTDACLPHLVQMRDMKSLYFWKTKVTDEGISKIKNVMKEANIVGNEEIKLIKAEPENNRR